MKQQQFNLIDGIFDSEEAKEILLCLIDSKIQFHNNRIFSHEIRFGTKNNDSVNRIEELKETKKQILQMIEGGNFSINSQINIESIANSNAA